MHISYTPEQDQLRQQLRDYFAGLMTPELRAALSSTSGEYGDGDAYKQVVRQLGRDGWLALGWPAEYGGRDGSVLDQLIFTDEAAIAGVPVPFLTVNTVGPTIMRFGTAEQKQRFLPAIAAGELHFSIGYSEPGAGTDLASLRTRAVTRRRQLRRQRPEDVDQPDPVRRLRLAGLPDRPGRRPAQGPVHHHRADGRGRLLLDSGPHAGRSDDQRHVLLRRPRPGGQSGRRGAPGLAADHQPAQPRAGRAHLGGARAVRAGRSDRLGPVGQAVRRPPRHRPGVGPAQPGPGARQGRVPQADELADRRRSPGRSARRPRRRPRSTAPS